MSDAPDDPHEPRDETTPTESGASPSPPDSGTPADEMSDRRRAGQRYGLRDGLREFTDFLRALGEVGERSGTGHVETNRTTLDYGVNVGVGPGPSDRSNRRSQGSTRRRVRRTNERYRVTTRQEDDVFVVTADLPGVESDELTVGFEDDRETLVVAVDGQLVRRVTVPWSNPTTEKSSLKNGVLEVRLGREGERP